MEQEDEDLGADIAGVRRWEHFEHAADMGVRGIGPTCETAFEEAAMALCATITDPALVHPDVLVEMSCHAADTEFLFVDWLNSLIAEMSARRMIFSKFSVTISNGHLHGRAWGEAADPERHHPAVEIKGATLTELKVFQNREGIWTAQCVVDV